MSDFWEPFHVPFDVWVQSGVDNIMPTLRPFFQVIKMPIEVGLYAVQHALLSVPPLVALFVVFLTAWQIAGFQRQFFA